MKDLNSYIIYSIFDNVQSLKDFTKISLLNKNINVLCNNYKFKNLSKEDTKNKRIVFNLLNNKKDYLVKRWIIINPEPDLFRENLYEFYDKMSEDLLEFMFLNDQICIYYLYDDPDRDVIKANKLILKQPNKINERDIEGLCENYNEWGIRINNLETMIKSLTNIKFIKDVYIKYNKNELYNQ